MVTTPYYTGQDFGPREGTAYTTVMPQEGMKYVYDQQGTRHSVPTNFNVSSGGGYTSLYKDDPIAEELAAGIQGTEVYQGSPYALANVPEFEGIQYATPDYNRYQDLYNLYLGGGFDAAQDDFVTPPASGGGGGGGGGSGVDTGGGTGGDNTYIGGGASLEDAGGTYPGGYHSAEGGFEYTGTPTSDPFLASGAAGGARLPSTSPQEGFLASGAAGGARLPAEQQDPSWWEARRNDFIETGQDINNIFTSLKNKGIDIGKMAGSAIMNMVQPGLGLLAHLLPEETPIDKFNRKYALGGDFYQDIVSQADDPNLERRIEGYANDLIAGTGEGKDPFGINTVSAFGNYPEYATETFNELTEKAKQRATEGKELSQFDKDRLEYYGHVSGLTGKTNVPGTPIMIDDPKTSGQLLDEFMEEQKKVDYENWVSEFEGLGDPDKQATIPLGKEPDLEIKDISKPDWLIEDQKKSKENLDQWLDETKKTNDDLTVESIANIADRQPEVIEQKKNELADVYDRQVERGERDADPTTTSKVNKAKAVINMPQMLGDVGGSMDRDPAPQDRPDKSGSPSSGFTNPGAGSYGPHSGGGSGNGGSSGGGGCVIATHAVNSGAFTKDTKREAVRWCIKNLHRTWWGEAVRRGYRYYGQKAIEEGNAKNHYQEFKDYVAFGTGKRRTLKTGWTFVYRTVQFFLKGLTL